MKKNIEKYQVFIYLVLIILGLLAVKLKYGYRGNESINSEQLTTVSPTLPAIEPTPDVKKDHPLEKELPYYGRGFVVTRYTAPLTLEMKLNGATSTQASKDITAWINSFGDEIGQHTVVVGETATATPTSAKKLPTPTAGESVIRNP